MVKTYAERIYELKKRKVTLVRERNHIDDMVVMFERLGIKQV